MRQIIMFQVEEFTDEIRQTLQEAILKALPKSESLTLDDTLKHIRWLRADDGFTTCCIEGFYNVISEKAIEELTYLVDSQILIHTTKSETSNSIVLFDYGEKAKRLSGNELTLNRDLYRLVKPHVKYYQHVEPVVAWFTTTLYPQPDTLKNWRIYLFDNIPDAKQLFPISMETMWSNVVCKLETKAAKAIITSVPQLLTATAFTKGMMLSQTDGCVKFINCLDNAQICLNSEKLDDLLESFCNEIKCVSLIEMKSIIHEYTKEDLPI